MNYENEFQVSQITFPTSHTSQPQDEDFKASLSVDNETHFLHIKDLTQSKSKVCFHPGYSLSEFVT